MDQDKALRILGLSSKTTRSELKKRYRALMMETHPDVNDQHTYGYDASEINVAYEYLDRHGINPRKTRVASKSCDAGNAGKDASAGSGIGGQTEGQAKSPIKWSAPQNPNAYADRKILHKVEGDDGQVIGTAVLDKGRFYWTEDEGFDMFLRSLYECSMELVGNGDNTAMAEVAYLLSQQFVNRDKILGGMAEHIEAYENQTVFCFDAMLEVDKRRWVLHEGDYLYPSRIADHRLYLKDVKKRELGYLSFKDDRLYYAIVPVFERRAAKVQIQVKDGVQKGSGGLKYYPVDLKMILIPEDGAKVSLHINSQINEILGK